MSVKAESKDKCVDCGHPCDLHRERGCLYVGSQSEAPEPGPITLCRCKKLVTAPPKG